MITIENLTYTYPQQDQPALQVDSWHVAAAEFVLLTGPSGSGKSTLLRCLNGLVPHFSGGKVGGKVQVAGLDAVAAGPRLLSQTVGFVMQTPEAQAILERVEAEIAFGMEQAAVPPREIKTRLDEVLALLNLEPFRKRPLRSLSGGERQRVAIAAALALRPQILVLDEPTSQLDAQSAADVLDSLVQLQKRLGLTILLAEHRLARILPHADRICVLEAGHMVGDGPVQTMLSQLPTVPPLIEVGLKMGWQPLPLTVKAASKKVEQAPLPDMPLAESKAMNEVADDAQLLEEKTAVLSIQNLSIHYGKISALRKVSLTVQSGEIVALLGRNGSGKSTLLKSVVGLLAADGGQVRLNGRLTTGRTVADICREVAYLPQNPDDLLFANSVREELAVTLANHGLQGQEARLETLLAQLELTAVSDSYPRDLSVGQRQRVALGAVAITEPPLLLLDEPTRGLDQAAKDALVDIWEGWRQAGKGILLVTHDVELAAKVADRVVILEAGAVVDSGEKTAVFSRSPQFAPQIAQLFPGKGWLTAKDVS